MIGKKIEMCVVCISIDEEFHFSYLSAVFVYFRGGKSLVPYGKPSSLSQVSKNITFLSLFHFVI